MSKKHYGDYVYIDPESLYTYPNSSVLINKFNEHDISKVHELEYHIFAVKSLQLFLNPISVFSMNDVLKIHRFVFEDIYSWAGQYRKVNISTSGNAFMPVQSFNTAEKYLNGLLTDFHSTAHARAEITNSLTEILDNLN